MTKTNNSSITVSHVVLGTASLILAYYAIKMLSQKSGDNEESPLKNKKNSDKPKHKKDTAWHKFWSAVDKKGSNIKSKFCLKNENTRGESSTIPDDSISDIKIDKNSYGTIPEDDGHSGTDLASRINGGKIPVSKSPTLESDENHQNRGNDDWVVSREVGNVAIKSPSKSKNSSVDETEISQESWQVNRELDVSKFMKTPEKENTEISGSSTTETVKDVKTLKELARKKSDTLIGKKETETLSEIQHTLDTIVMKAAKNDETSDEIYAPKKDLPEHCKEFRNEPIAVDSETMVDRMIILDGLVTHVIEDKSGASSSLTADEHSSSINDESSLLKSKKNLPGNCQEFGEKPTAVNSDTMMILDGLVTHVIEDSAASSSKNEDEHSSSIHEKLLSSKYEDLSSEPAKFDESEHNIYANVQEKSKKLDDDTSSIESGDNEKEIKAASDFELHKSCPPPEESNPEETLNTEESEEYLKNLPENIDIITSGRKGISTNDSTVIPCDSVDDDFEVAKREFRRRTRTIDDSPSENSTVDEKNSDKRNTEDFGTGPVNLPRDGNSHLDEAEKNPGEDIQK